MFCFFFVWHGRQQQSKGWKNISHLRQSQFETKLEWCSKRKVFFCAKENASTPHCCVCVCVCSCVKSQNENTKFEGLLLLFLENSACKLYTWGFFYWIFKPHRALPYPIIIITSSHHIIIAANYFLCVTNVFVCGVWKIKFSKCILPKKDVELIRKSCFHQYSVRPPPNLVFFLEDKSRLRMRRVKTNKGLVLYR